MNRLIRYCDGLMESTWLLALIFTPLYFPLFLEQPAEFGKTIMLRALVLIGVSAWITKWISAGIPHFERKSIPMLWAKIISQPLALLVGALAVVYTLSTVFSIAPRVSLLGSYTRFEGLIALLSYIMLFALMATNLRRREQVDRLITTLAAVSFAVDLYAILQHFGLDPVIWGSQVSVVARAISTIGHPIFMAAFLGMTLMIMLGRVVFLIRSYLQASAPRAAKISLIVLYLIVCALNLLSIWYSVARGPLIALFFGLFFFGFSLLVYWQLRRTFYIFAAIGACLMIFIAVLNIPNGPLSGLRDKSYIGPLGHVFDTQTGTTGRARVLIWNGMMRLVSPHDPIQLPDTQSEDRWNAIRPLVGYGPETIPLVYENYYLPEMFAMESYDLEHDHAHNEFWDVLALYGLLGFFVEYGFFLSLIYFALKWLGWISSALESRFYWLLSFLGGVLGGIIAFVTAGAEFLGLGIPLGLLLGATGILFLRMFRNNTTIASKSGLWRDTILISFLALIVFHYVEILFGIPINTSRVVFWAACGVMLAVGQGMLTDTEKISGQNNNMGTAKDAGFQQSRLRTKTSKKTTRLAGLNDTQQIGVHIGIVVAIIIAMTPILISTDPFGLDASTIIKNSLMSNSAGILWIFLGIVLFTSLIFELESVAFSGDKVSFKNLILLFVIALFASFLIWGLYANQLAALWKLVGISSSQIITLYLNIISTQFVTLIIFAYIWALLLPESSNTRMAAPKPLVIAGFGLIHTLVLVLSILINLHPLQANGIAKLFIKYIQYSFVDPNLFSDTFEIGERLLELDPSQSMYFITVADAAVEYANALTAPQSTAKYLSVAEEYYKQAYSLNPLYYRNTIRMAGINRAWAKVSQDVTTRKARLAQAEQYYTNTLDGKPYRVKLWVEWADFQKEFGDLQTARQKIDAAIKIDTTYAPAYQLSADIYLIEAKKQSDATKRTELLDKALKDFTTAIEMMNRRSENPSSALLQLGNVYTLLEQYDQARDAYLQAEKLGLGNDQWQVYQKLAELSGKINDSTAQREYLNQAIRIAPPNEIQNLQAMLDALQP